MQARGWGLQTWRGCYAKAIEHNPVLQVGLDKCGASVDWQIQFAWPYCRQGMSHEEGCGAGEKCLCSAKHPGNSYYAFGLVKRGSGLKTHSETKCQHRGSFQL